MFIAFLADYSVGNKIIDHFKLTLIAEKHSPPHSSIKNYGALPKHPLDILREFLIRKEGVAGSPTFGESPRVYGFFIATRKCVQQILGY